MGKGLCHTLLTPSGITEPEPQHSAMNDDNDDASEDTFHVVLQTTLTKALQKT